jgi:hypothetical protein
MESAEHYPERFPLERLRVLDAGRQPTGTALEYHFSACSCERDSFKSDVHNKLNLPVGGLVLQMTNGALAALDK